MSDGTIERTENRVTFRYERRLRHPVSVVWKAITDPEQVAAWFGARVEIDLKPGGHYISYHPGDVRVVDRIVRLDAPTLLEHTFWAEVNPDALVTWELHPSEEGCVLVLSHSLSIADIEAARTRFGDDPTLILSRNAAGWHHLLDKLGASLDSTPLDWSEQAQKALQARYAAMPATISPATESNVRSSEH
jgi:uncharacterized protein YndB with AHSA1/START domain